MLRKRGIHAEIKPSHPEITAELYRQLHVDEGIPMPEQQLEPPATTKINSTKIRQLQRKAEEDKLIFLRINLKQIQEQQAMDNVVSNSRELLHHLHPETMSFSRAKNF
jgi:hypothetical protein